ncbi:MAG TPA: hypothetical protein P5105_05680 [Victivallales bacterium]|nr:hypothetical protein [Victivallales bacterium]
MQCENTSELVDVIDEMIDALEQQKIEKLDPVPEKAIHWNHLSQIVAIKNDELRLNEFTKFCESYNILGIKELLKQDTPLFKDERLKFAVNRDFIPATLHNVILLIRALYCFRNLHYFDQIDDVEYNPEIALTEEKFNSIDYALNHSYREPILFLKNENCLVELFHLLIKEGFVCKYVVGAGYKAKHNLTKVQWHHFMANFTFSKKKSSDDEKEIEKNLITEFKKRFYIEKNIIINKDRPLECTRFIWLKKERLLVHLFQKLTEKGIIRKTKIEEKPDEDEDENEENSQSHNKKTSDNKSKNKKEKLPPVDWQSITKHFMIVKNGALEVLDNEQLNKQKNLLKSHKQPPKEYSFENKMYAKVQGTKHMKKKKNSIKIEYEQISKIVSQVELVK